MRLPRVNVDPGRTGDGREELRRIHPELVIEAVARRRFDRRDQIADRRHQAGAERPPPFALLAARTAQARSHGHHDQSSRRPRVQNGARPLGARFSGSMARRRRLRLFNDGRRQPRGWLRGRGTRIEEAGTLPHGAYDEPRSHTAEVRRHDSCAPGRGDEGESGVSRLLGRFVMRNRVASRLSSIDSSCRCDVSAGRCW